MGKFLEKEDMTPLKEVSKVIDSLNTEEDKIINAPSINAVNEEFSKYQKKEDNALSTNSKNIVGAINEVSQNLTQEITNRTNAVNSKADKALTNYNSNQWAKAVSECSEIIVIGYTGDTPVYVSVIIPTYVLSDEYIYFNTQTTVANKRYIIQVKCNKNNLVRGETKIYIDGVANEFANWWILGRK